MMSCWQDIAKLKLGSVAGSPVGCVFSQVFLGNLTYANITMGGISHPLLSGFISRGVDELFNGIADTVFILYEEVVEKILPGLINTDVRTALNQFFIAYLNDPVNSICPRCELSETHHCVPSPIMFMNFMTTHEVIYVAWLLNEAVGVDNLNNAIGSVTKGGRYSSTNYLVDSVTELKVSYTSNLPPTPMEVCA